MFSAKKLSKFAQERAKQTKALEKEKSNTESGFTASNIIIGNIVERKEGIGLDRSEVECVSFDDSVGFPKPKRIDKKVLNSFKKKEFLFSFHHKIDLFFRLNLNQPKPKVFSLNFIRRTLNRARVHQSHQNQN